VAADTHTEVEHMPKVAAEVMQAHTEWVEHTELAEKSKHWKLK